MAKAKSPDTFEEIQCACTNLRIASRVVSRVYDQALSDLNINGNQYGILVTIQRYQPVSQIAVADHLGLERTSLYRAIAILEKNAWVKVTDAGEGVAKNLQLTAAGEKLVREARKAWDQAQDEFVASLGQKKWSEFQSLLSEIKTHFRE